MTNTADRPDLSNLHWVDGRWEWRHTAPRNTASAPRYGGPAPRSEQAAGQVPPRYRDRPAPVAAEPVVEHRPVEHAVGEHAAVSAVAHKPARQFQAVNLFSLRVWYTAMFAAFVGTMILLLLLNLVWTTPVFLPYVIFVALLLPTLSTMCTGTPVVCPECLKRIKMGATRCHHCNYSYA